MAYWVYLWYVGCGELELWYAVGYFGYEWDLGVMFGIYGVFGLVISAFGMVYSLVFWV